MKGIGGIVSRFADYSPDRVVKIAYENRPTEIWVHSREKSYLEIYNQFCYSELNVKLAGSYKTEGFAVDHSYNKAEIPDEVDAYIRRFLVKAGPNSSLGSYYEQRLKDLFLKRGRAGLRKDTVAIRAKISGITAPLKGSKTERSLDNVAHVVRQLIELGLTSEEAYQTDCKTLAAFCGMADGEGAVAMSVELA